MNRNHTILRQLDGGIYELLISHLQLVANLPGPHQCTTISTRLNLSHGCDDWVIGEGEVSFFFLVAFGFFA